MTVASPVAVLGAGNGGLALAGDLASRGRTVRLYEHPDFASSTVELREDPILTLVDALGHRTSARIDRVTHDLSQALDGVDIVHLVVPVSVQEVYFNLLLPVLGSARVLVLWAGRFGALRFRKLAREAGVDVTPVIEVNTLPYGCRRVGSSEVRIAFRALKMFAAGVPKAATEAALAMLVEEFPQLVAVENPIEVALRNSSMLVLGVGPLLNMGAIETNGPEFALFRDGMTPAVRAVVKAVHAEFIAVGRAWNVRIPRYSEAVYTHPTSVEGANFRDSSGGYDGFALLTGPDRMIHRYTIENVRYGFAIVASLGRAAGVATPLLDGLTEVAGAACGAEFANTGWGLADLDLPLPSASSCS